MASTRRAGRRPGTRAWSAAHQNSPEVIDLTLSDDEKEPDPKWRRTTAPYLEEPEARFDKHTGNTIGLTSYPVKDEPESSCVICYDSDKQRADFPQKDELPNSCKSHATQLCRSCIRQHIDAQLETGRTNAAPCPSCAADWPRPTLLKLASPDAQARISREELMETLRAMPEWRECLSGDCQSGQFHSSGAGEPIVRCRECGSRSCFNHLIPWHEGITCAGYDRRQREVRERGRKRRREELELEEQETKKVARPCPKCNVSIQKDGGCDHMTCRCGFQFCYECGADYKKVIRGSNVDHLTTCRYHPRQLEATRGVDPHQRYT